MQVHQWSRDDVDKWRVACEPILAEWLEKRGSDGQEIYTIYKEALIEAGATSP